MDSVEKDIAEFNKRLQELLTELDLVMVADVVFVDKLENVHVVPESVFKSRVRVVRLEKAKKENE